ncbi:MAG: hypothetical protein FWD45_00620 [Coriobacteriia bacterium]|nr:hypothetical protein [Coriobacteriia bacterium]
MKPTDQNSNNTAITASAASASSSCSTRRPNNTRVILSTLLVFALLTLSACSGSQSNRPPSGSNSQGSGAGAPVNAYEAYYRKYLELVDDYGDARVLDTASTDTFAWGTSYFAGVCVVSLMDFNQDGVRDLFVVYMNGELLGVNIDGNEVPLPESYTIEIWSYLDGEMVQLLHVPEVSFFQSFANDYWNSECCFVTVFESPTGYPVVQVYGESPQSCYFRNIYFTDGDVASNGSTPGGSTQGGVTQGDVTEDILTYFAGSSDSQSAGRFMLNENETTEDVWITHYAGFNKILLSASLSNQIPSYWISEFGISYASTLTNTQSVVRSLSESRPAEFAVAENDALPQYLAMLDRANRERFAEPSRQIPDIYCLYDLNQDSNPEMIIQTGEFEAARQYEYYLLIDGTLTQHYPNLSGSHSNLFANGLGGLIQYSTHMNYYSVYFIVWDGTTLERQEFTSGEDLVYPELEDLGFEGYTYLPMSFTPLQQCLYLSFCE